MRILLSVVAIAVGMLIAVQPALNAQLAKSLGHTFYGSLTNFAVGLCVVVLVGVTLFRPALPSADAIASAPWWAWCGGLLGATFVTMAILLLPRLGAVLFIGCILVGQLIASSFIDQFGLLGVRTQAVTPTRAIGLALLIIGLLFVQIGTPPAPRSPAPAAETDPPIQTP